VILTIYLAYADPQTGQSGIHSEPGAPLVLVDDAIEWRREGKPVRVVPLSSLTCWDVAADHEDTHPETPKAKARK